MLRVSKHIHNPSTLRPRVKGVGLKLQHDDSSASDDCVPCGLDQPTPVRSVHQTAPDQRSRHCDHDIKRLSLGEPHVLEHASPVGEHDLKVLRGRWPDVVCVHQTSSSGHCAATISISTGVDLTLPAHSQQRDSTMPINWAFPTPTSGTCTCRSQTRLVTGASLMTSSRATAVLICMEPLLPWLPIK